jgi:hypothetical protein
LRGAFDLGPTRTLQQDVEFGVLQIVDIALKARSPAVNDPSTAISCVDQLSRILIRFASRQEPASLLYDAPGAPRASMLWPDFERLVDAAFDQIRLYARVDLAVSLRMLRALGDVARTIPDSAVRRRLFERGERIVAGCAEKLDEDELGELRLPLATLGRRAGAARERGDRRSTKEAVKERRHRCDRSAGGAPSPRRDAVQPRSARWSLFLRNV